MTIAVVWHEDDHLWCAADTRLVSDPEDRPTTEIGSKIYSIPLAIHGFGPDGFPRAPHYWTQYGFVYAGAALPASMTAATASTLLQRLVRPGGIGDPPPFEDVSELVGRLARRFMTERRRFGAEGLFSAAFFGWCPLELKFKVALIEGKDDAIGFRVDWSYPPKPTTDGQPWVVLGSGTPAFEDVRAKFLVSGNPITKRVPRRVIEKMIADDADATVGGSTSMGAVSQQGFELFWTAEPVVHGQSKARRMMNGLDLDVEVGSIGPYQIGGTGFA